MISFPISLSFIMSLSILYRFRDTTTFTVYVTACDLRSPAVSIRQLNYRQQALPDSCVNTPYM